MDKNREARGIILQGAVRGMSQTFLLKLSPTDPLNVGIAAAIREVLLDYLPDEQKEKAAMKKKTFTQSEVLKALEVAMLYQVPMKNRPAVIKAMVQELSRIRTGETT